ncbi:MAG: hypothetical protein AB8G11_18955 [Saprospiraceae bacterium]
MKKLQAQELKNRFIEILSNHNTKFSYEKGNPFLLKINTKSYYIFLKNISSAAFKKYPNKTRVQLPTSKHFLKIAKTDIPFIILGYDSLNDVFVSWNPNKVRDRLNTKKNISLYSRESWQSEVIDFKLKISYLSNKDKVLLFKSNMLNVFLNTVIQFFGEDSEKANDEEQQTEINESKGKIDDTLLEKITPSLGKNRVLEAVNICMNYHENQYDMTFKDWFDLVNIEYEKLQDKKSFK